MNIMLIYNTLYPLVESHDSYSYIHYTTKIDWTPEDLHKIRLHVEFYANLMLSCGLLMLHSILVEVNFDNRFK